MSRRVLFVSLLALACAHSAPGPVKAPSGPAAQATPAPAAKPSGEGVLQNAPAIPPLSPFNAPVPTVKTLPNGLTLYVVERPGEEIEALQVVLKKGGTSDPQRLQGLASLSAAMLQTGAGGMGQLELARALDGIGAQLFAGAGDDSTQIGLSAMPTHLPKMVRLLSAVTLHPTLSPAEFRKLRAQRIAQVVAQQADPVATLGRTWRQATYGPHPLGHALVGTPASLKRIQLADVRTFVRAWAPGDAAVIAVGGAKAGAVMDALTQAFGGWRGRSKPDTALAQRVQAAPPPSPRFVAVGFPHKPQTVIEVGAPAVSRASPDYLALNLLNAVLGGSFTSRLNQNLREQHGYTYGAFSGFSFGRGPGPFVVQTSVKTDTTAASLEEIFKELDRAVSQPISQAELEKGKALLAFDLVQTLQHAEGTAGAIASLFLYDLPLDEYQTFVPRLNALTVADVHQASQRTLKPDQMTVGIAGDLDQVLPTLEKLPAPKLGEPQRWTPEGEQVR
jgi:zinc protease